MKLTINESEKQRILNLYNRNFLFEQAGDITIADLQRLIGVTADNQMGPQTVAVLKQMLKTIPGNGCTNSGNKPVPDVGGNKGFNPYQQTDYTK